MVTVMPSEQADLLNGLSADAADAILAMGTPLRLDAGACLFRLGDAAECVYLIRRGRIVLTLPMQIGGRREEIVVEEHVPGQTVGWSALIGPHRFTLTAAAPLGTELLALRRVDLMEYCAAHPDVGYTVALNIAAVVGRRLQVFQAMWLRQMQRAVSHASA